MPLLTPARIELRAWGNRWSDIGFGVGDELLLSRQLHSALIAAGVRGVEKFLPVEVVRATARRRLSAPPEYVLLQPTRGGATVDAELSGLVPRKELCSHCFSRGIVRRWTALALLPDTWTGEDAFYPLGLPGTIIVTEKFRRICLEMGQGGEVFVPAGKYSRDFYPP